MGIIKDQLALGEARAVSTPGTKEEGRTARDQEEPLDDEQATKYRALTARCNYFSPGRPDVAFAAKGLARNMASPRKGRLDKVETPRSLFRGAAQTPTMVRVAANSARDRNIHGRRLGWLQRHMKVNHGWCDHNRRTRG